jgi:hypothetical protein
MCRHKCQKNKDKNRHEDKPQEPFEKRKHAFILARFSSLFEILSLVPVAVRAPALSSPVHVAAPGAGFLIAPDPKPKAFDNSARSVIGFANMNAPCPETL